MKTNYFKLFRTLKAFLLIAAVSILTISCDNEETEGMDVMNSSKNLTGESFKSTNSAPKPGDTPIAGIAINAGFNELVGALVYVDNELNAGLVNLFLNGKDQYTVFAPTDAAFKNLYAALGVNKITDLPAPLVLDVLKYHVVEGRRAANSVVPKNGSREITTLLGSTFSVNSNGIITAVGNTAGIAAANISASNGIIHVVNAVLLPINP
ncbi:fasciclin domain-containing protein [Flavobacterium caseinilyticum]|uniref:Fasciclin domain-containing protein n=1 Tax=Flavobacterium caseinilyticum TaxID=2541732 RepID=A0A4R5AXY4_9FLAO|nr:fasciclin domain-containing protein [Flavobacterium caseinilyticum]TDD76929.1 fasciclin domain-containing protein [Flavobacterium caseinilyticum]